MSEYVAIKQQIESLQQQMIEARQRETVEAIAKIKELIATFDITPAQIFDVPVRTRQKPGRKPKSAA